MQQLTKRQQEIYNFIRATIASKGYGPSMREIGDRFGIGSLNAVEQHLKALEKKGAIVRAKNGDRRIARAIMILRA